MTATAPDGKAIELAGMVTALNVLRPLTADLAAVCAAVEQRVAESPGLFRGAALVIDLTALDAPPGGDAAAAPQAFALQELVSWLKQRELVPVAACTHDASRARAVAAAGLGMIEVAPRPSARGARKPRNQTTAQEVAAALADEAAAAAAAAATAAPAVEPALAGTASQPALTLTQPLRAGQVVVAEGRDAIALAAVNSGAELIADGNIHVYAPLRGRALAGANGNEQARIFCQKLEADLVSIAGVYLSADALPQDKIGKPVQISLRNGELVVADLTGR